MSFVHLRTHTEFSVVDGTLRIDDAAAAARADGQGAGHHRPRQPVRRRQVLQGLPQRASSRFSAPMSGWSRCPRPASKPPSRLLLLVQDKRGYLNLCELLARAWAQRAAQPGLVKWDWLREHGDGLIALSGADAGAVGRRCWPATGRARARAVAQRWRRCSRALLHRAAARRPARQRGHVRAAVPLAARAAACRWWPRTRCSS
jgi:DNA polymerase III subunit alpha